jgi:hypothetical protein
MLQADMDCLEGTSSRKCQCDRRCCTTAGRRSRRA